MSIPTYRATIAITASRKNTTVEAEVTCTAGHHHYTRRSAERCASRFLRRQPGFAKYAPKVTVERH